MMRGQWGHMSPFQGDGNGARRQAAPKGPGPKWLLGQRRETQYDFNVIQDALKDIGISESEINDLINKLPSDAAGPYRQQLEECKKLGLTTGPGARCAYELFQLMKSGAPAPSKLPMPATPSASSFPFVPVAIGVLLAGGLIWFLVSRNS